MIKELPMITCKYCKNDDISLMNIVVMFKPNATIECEVCSKMFNAPISELPKQLTGPYYMHGGKQ